MRKMYHDILNECARNKIHAACMAFDGAFQHLAVCSFDGKPLTLILMTNDLWKDITSLSQIQVVSIHADVNLELKQTKHTSRELHSECLS